MTKCTTSKATMSIVAIASMLLISPTAAKDMTPAEAAAAEDAVLLQPASPWNVDYDDNKCRLARVFGPENARHVLLIDQGIPNDTIMVTLAGPALKRFQQASRLEFGMRGDSPLERQERYGSGDLGEFGPAVIFRTVDLSATHEPDEPRRLGIDEKVASSIDRIVIQRGSRVLSLETGNMAEAFQALNRCMSDLLTTWGLDAEEHALFRPANWSNEEKIARRLLEDYSDRIARSGEQGSFRMRVIVEKNGSVSDCLVEAATVVERLQSSICDLMKSETLQPAENASGEAIRSFYGTMVSYQLSD